jgi:hypothetical protein
MISFDRDIVCGRRAVVNVQEIAVVYHSFRFRSLNSGGHSQQIPPVSLRSRVGMTRCDRQAIAQFACGVDEMRPLLHGFVARKISTSALPVKLKLRTNLKSGTAIRGLWELLPHCLFLNN